MQHIDSTSIPNETIKYPRHITNDTPDNNHPSLSKQLASFSGRGRALHSYEIQSPEVSGASFASVAALFSCAAALAATSAKSDTEAATRAARKLASARCKW